MRLIRRIHLYLGLILMPWVMLFGITALSFNHPTVGRDITGQMLPPPRLKELTGVGPVQPEQLAKSVVQGLDHYQLEEGSARLSGWPLFTRPAPGGPEVVILGLDQGRAIITKRTASGESKKPDFSGKEVPLQEFDMEEMAEKLSPIHDKLNRAYSGPLRPHPKIHPELRFVAKDNQGTRWNVVYDLTTQVIDGRPSDEARHAPLVELLESMHKQHHYPANFGPTFFWALFADLTALTLLIWAITGLVMWWQLKKLRVYGAVCLTFAVILAYFVMVGTAKDLSFGPERGGGEGPG